MKYKLIELKNGNYFMCPSEQEFATDRQLTVQEKVIIELSERIEKLDSFIDSLTEE